MAHKLKNGTALPHVGFGTWQILLNNKAKNAVKEALSSGYRLIDTARIYGNEKGVGNAIRESAIDRSEIILTTKLWNNSHGHDSVMLAFDKSLRRLGVDYIDLYLIHWPVEGHRQETWRALEFILNEGRTRAIGVANYTVRHLEELLLTANIIPAVNQVEFHPFLYKEQIELLEFCKKHGILVEAYSPLAHGYRMDDPVLIKIAKEHSKSVAQVMLRWATQHGTIPIPKSSNPGRIRENIEIFDFVLSDEEIYNINELSDGLRTCWNPETMK